MKTKQAFLSRPTVIATILIASISLFSCQKATTNFNPVNSTTGGGSVNFNAGPGVNTGGFVFSTLQYNNNLIVGGNFTSAGNTTTNNIAQWNGNAWAALDSGLNGNVYAMTTYNGNLIVGGSFINAGNKAVNGIAQWNGTSWSAMGNGFSLLGSSYGIFDLQVYNNNLYAAGQFDSVSSTNAMNLAVWTGTTWKSVAKMPQNSLINVLAVYNNQLIVGGLFDSIGGIAANNIAAYNGTTWSPILTGTSYSVFALATYNGNLYVGGDFTTAGGVVTNGIAAWNGANWQALTTGVNGAVYDLFVQGTNLVVAGSFTTAGTANFNNIAQWNGSNWLSPYGAGATLNSATSIISPAVQTLSLFNGNLIVGGYFNVLNTLPANNIGQWNGTNWSAL